MYRDKIMRSVMKRRWLSSLLLPIKKPVRKTLDFCHKRLLLRKSEITQLQCKKAADTVPNLVVAIMVVRNEIGLLPLTIQHHRKLGVKHFKIIDNSSTDGTYEWLMEQSDIEVYSTTESYSKSYAGLTWSNKLIAKLKPNSWALVIDADELLQYPTMGHQTIEELVDDLTARNMTFLYTPMIDLFGFSISNRNGSYRLNDAWHDQSSYFKTENVLASGHHEIKGGFKFRMLDQAGFDPDLSSRLTKFALIKVLPGRLFTASTHEFMPTVQEAHQLQGHLFHLKFGHDYFQRHGNLQIEQEHYLQGTERATVTRAYQQLLGSEKLYVGAVQAEDSNDMSWLYNSLPSIE